jgi:hypothetical protein
MKNPFVLRLSVVLEIAACAIAFADTQVIAAPTARRMETSEEALRRRDHPDYRHHIVAIDEFGSAMEVIDETPRTAGAKRRLVLKRFPSEDTEHFLARNDTDPNAPVFVQCDGQPQRVTNSQPYWKLFRWEFMRQMHARRGQPDDYTRDFGLPPPESDGIFENYRRLRAAGVVDHVVIYIHGGLNFIGSAGVKACELTGPMLQDRAYPIFIIWNSNLFGTYGEHLWAVREGQHHPFFGAATLPLQLAADVGTAVARAPLSLVKLGRNDGYHNFPDRSPRYQLTLNRYETLREAYLGGPGGDSRSEIAVSAGEVWEPYPNGKLKYGTDKTLGMQASSFASWLAWIPAKAATTPLIDTLGTSAWFNMIRRTRVMFERESFFVRPLLSKKIALPSVDAASADLRYQAGRSPLESDRKLRWFCRQGALRLFFQEAEAQLAMGGKGFLPITLIGHSMGCIVAGEIVARFPKFPVDDLVFMAAASTVNDFKLKVVPFLSANQQTHFYNLCLRTSAETGEREPWDYIEPAPRGSLLVWIDSLFDAPIAEDDRTLGRWDNALLAMDWLPDTAASRTTIKGFGADRLQKRLSDTAVVPFPYEVNGRTSSTINNLKLQDKDSEKKWLSEPQKHGAFTSFEEGGLYYPFWRPYYWHAERTPKISRSATKPPASAVRKPAWKAPRQQPIKK